MHPHESHVHPKDHFSFTQKKVMLENEGIKSLQAVKTQVHQLKIHTKKNLINFRYLTTED